MRATSTGTSSGAVTGGLTSLACEFAESVANAFQQLVNPRRREIFRMGRAVEADKPAKEGHGEEGGMGDTETEHQWTRFVLHMGKF